MYSFPPNYPNPQGSQPASFAPFAPPYNQKYDSTFRPNREVSAEDTIPVTLIVDSTYRDNSASSQPNQYSMTLPSTIRDVLSIQLVYADIPSNNYNVTQYNNQLTFTDQTGVQHTVSLAPGLYTPTQFTVSLTAVMNTAYGAGDFSASITSVADSDVVSATVPVGLLRIRSQQVVTLDFSAGPAYGTLAYPYYSLGRIAGFEPYNYTSSSITPIQGYTEQILSTYPPNLTVDSMVSLYIQDAERVNSNNGLGVDRSYAVLPLNIMANTTSQLAVGDLIDEEERIYYYVTPRQISRLYFSFYDMYGNLYDFQGQNHAMVFQLRTNARQVKYSGALSKREKQHHARHRS